MLKYTYDTHSNRTWIYTQSELALWSTVSWMSLVQIITQFSGGCLNTCRHDGTFLLLHNIQWEADKTFGGVHKPPHFLVTVFIPNYTHAATY